MTYKKILILVLIIFTSVFISGCKANIESKTGKTVYRTTPEIVSEISSPLEVYFCPEDNCAQYIINLIDDATTSIHCAFYNLELENIINKLKNKKIEVKLVADKKYTKKLIGLNYIKNDYTKQLMHDKFCVFDNKIVLTGSLNPTERGNFKNNNNIVILYSKYLAENYEDEFEELWNKEFGSGEEVKYPLVYLNNHKIENYFCPEDSCEEHVIDILEDAEENIYFMTFSFTSDNIGDTLINKYNEGVVVKGVFEKSQNNKWSEYPRLKDNNLDVKFDNNKYNMHHKVFIVDNKIVITGSFNPTKSGDERNDENILIIYDEIVAEKYLDEFSRIYSK